jgi:hypothetical protein
MIVIAINYRKKLGKKKITHVHTHTGHQAADDRDSDQLSEILRGRVAWAAGCVCL